MNYEKKFQLLNTCSNLTIKTKKFRQRALDTLLSADCMHVLLTVYHNRVSFLTKLQACWSFLLELRARVLIYP